MIKGGFTMFDLKKISFSRRGSYLVISQKDDDFFIRHISGGDEDYGEIINFRPDDDFDVEFNELELIFKNYFFYHRFSFDDENSIRIKGVNAPLKLNFILKGYDYIVERPNGVEINIATKDVKILIKVIKGQYKLNSGWTGVVSRGASLIIYPEDYLDVKIMDYQHCFEYRFEEYDTSLERLKKDLNDFKSMFKFDLFKKGGELASYILWSNIVSKRGILKYDSIYMSKNYMTNIWSWDNLFNTMVLIDKDYDLAMNQIKVFLELQDKKGQIPDFANDKFCCYSFCKPPILGYFILNFIEEGYISKEDMKELYEPLSKWTLWWLNERDDDGDLLCQYNHGNESGWDNSTIFKGNIPVEAPDLTAYLILQCEALENIAYKIGKNFERMNWQDIKIKLQSNLLKMWEMDRFLAYDAYHNFIVTDSLQYYIPLILEDRLPEKIRESMVEQIKYDFITDYGIATEKITSRDFKPDGYWRGAIWAPTTYLLANAFDRIGYKKLARDIKIKFLKMLLDSFMEENFNPLTGEGQCDSGFAWTSSVFLSFAEEFSADFLEG